MRNDRKHFRSPEYVNALLLLINSDEAPIECRIVDQSPGGMKLLVSKHLAVGAIVEVLIDGLGVPAEVRYSAPRPMGQCEVGLEVKPRSL